MNARYYALERTSMKTTLLYICSIVPLFSYHILMSSVIHMATWNPFVKKYNSDKSKISLPFFVGFS